MTTINLTARQLASLVTPVLPFAGKDDYLPVINAVLVESNGQWLSATTTDRFRVGIQRITKHVSEDDPATDWPTFRALIPLRSVKSLLAMFKATRDTNPALSLTIDGETLIAEGAGGFDLFDSSRFTHRLLMGEFPGVRAMVRKALEATEAPAATFGASPAFLADYKGLGPGLRIKVGNGHRDPILLTNNEGFIGLLMPKKYSEADESWAEFFAEKPAAKKAASKKAAAA